MIGPAAWHSIRVVLQEENLIAASASNQTAVREFVSFASELLFFQPEHWHDFFPGLDSNGDQLSAVLNLVDSDRLFEQTRLGHASPDTESPDIIAEALPSAATATVSNRDNRRIDKWSNRGNDLGAAVFLARAGRPDALEYLDRLVARLCSIDDGLDDAAAWRNARN